MTPPRQSTPCPWCTHEATSDDDFRTHLMVEHRKSELARYVLDRQRAAGGDGREAEESEVDSQSDADGRSDSDDESDAERELLAR